MQSDQPGSFNIPGEPSSSFGPESRSFSSENYIPDTLHKPLEWKKFIFPQDFHLLYFGKMKTNRGYTIRTENTFLPVRSIQHDVHVNESGDVFGFKLHPKSNAIQRLYSSPYRIATINICKEKSVRLLTDEEKLYLSENPTGYPSKNPTGYPSKNLIGNPSKNLSISFRGMKKVWQIKQTHA